MGKQKKTHNLGERIKQLRVDNKLTQSALAEQLFVSDKVISKWENNKSIPDVDILLDLSNIFHVSIEYLLTGQISSKKTKGGQVVYNEDGSISHYLGEDGDRLFTRNEVTQIIDKRIKRYEQNLCDELGVMDIFELHSIVRFHFYLSEHFVTNWNKTTSERKSDNKVDYTVVKIVRDNMKGKQVVKLLNHLAKNGFLSQKEFEACLNILLSKKIITLKDLESEDPKA